MKLIIDIPEKWFNDMVREEFTEVDELCAIIQHGIPFPKTGRWIITPHGPKCSKCLIVHSHTSIFCPSCGAKMVEQETKINEDISKGFEEFTRMMFRQGQEESEDKE